MAGVKREPRVSHDLEDDDELTVLEERPRKRQHLPSEEDEVIVLDWSIQCTYTDGQ